MDDPNPDPQSIQAPFPAVPAFTTEASASALEHDIDRAVASQSGESEPVAIGALGGRRDLDAHAHVFLCSDPMAVPRRYTPSADAPLDAWLAHLDAHALCGGILVQPSFLGTNNARLLQSVAEARARGYEVYASAVVDPRATAGELADLVRRHVVSVRLNVVGRAAPMLDREPWDSFLDRLRARGLALELHADHASARALLPRLEAYGVWTVLDHYALAPSAEALGALLLAAGDRVMVKASAPYRLPGADPSHPSSAHRARSLNAALRRGLAGDRILYGSDWPHTQHADRTDFARAWGAATA